MHQCFVSCFIALCIPCGFLGATEALSPSAPIILFNGNDLSGWYSWLDGSKREDPGRVFRVEDRLLRISGDGFGYLSTEKAYRDYRLLLDFKWGERNWRGRERHARDSGIFLHSAGPDGNSYAANGAYKAAIECQVMQGSVGDLLLIGGRAASGESVRTQLSAEIAPVRDADGWPYWQKGGALVTLTSGRLNWFAKASHWKDLLDFRGARDIESPGFEWTRVECVCAGPTIQIFVNGTLVNEARAVIPSSGQILLQCEGSEILFRNVELRPLESPSR